MLQGAARAWARAAGEQDVAGLSHHFPDVPAHGAGIGEVGPADDEAFLDDDGFGDGVEGPLPFTLGADDELGTLFHLVLQRGIGREHLGTSLPQPEGELGVGDGHSDLGRPSFHSVQGGIGKARQPRPSHQLDGPDASGTPDQRQREERARLLAGAPLDARSHLRGELSVRLDERYQVPGSEFRQANRTDVEWLRLRRVDGNEAQHSVGVREPHRGAVRLGQSSRADDSVAQNLRQLGQGMEALHCVGEALRLFQTFLEGGADGGVACALALGLGPPQRWDDGVQGVHRMHAGRKRGGRRAVTEVEHGRRSGSAEARDEKPPVGDWLADDAVGGSAAHLPERLGGRHVADLQARAGERRQELVVRLHRRHHQGGKGAGHGTLGGVPR